MKLRPLGDKAILQYQEIEEKTQSAISAGNEEVGEMITDAIEKVSEIIPGQGNLSEGYRGGTEHKKCICFHAIEENGGRYG